MHIINALLDDDADEKLAKSSIIWTLKFQYPKYCNFLSRLVIVNKSMRLDFEFVNLLSLVGQGYRQLIIINGYENNYINYRLELKKSKRQPRV